LSRARSEIGAPPRKGRLRSLPGRSRLLPAILLSPPSAACDLVAMSSKAQTPTTISYPNRETCASLASFAQFSACPSPGLPSSGRLNAASRFSVTDRGPQYRYLKPLIQLNYANRYNRQKLRIFGFVRAFLPRSSTGFPPTGRQNQPSLRIFGFVRADSFLLVPGSPAGPRWFLSMKLPFNEGPSRAATQHPSNALTKSPLY
jgi:hypothetical protein